MVEVHPTRKVHGICHLPAGYRLCTVPFQAKLKPSSGQTCAAPGSGSRGPIFTPSCDTMSAKYQVLFSLVQAVAGGITIYRTRGDVSNNPQIDPHPHHESYS